MLKQNSHFILAVMVVFDLIILAGAFLLARFVTGFDMTLSAWKFKEVVISLAVVLVLFISLERFEFSHSYRYTPLSKMLKNLILFEFFLLSVFYFIIVFKIFPFHNKFVFYYAVFSFSIFFTERFLVKAILNNLRKIGFNYRTFLVLGAGDIGTDFYRMAISSNELGIKVVGFLDDFKTKKDLSDPIYCCDNKSLILGKTSKLESILKTKDIDNVVIALPMNAENQVIKMLDICEKYGVKAELIPRYFKIIASNPSVRHINKFTLIGIRNVPLENMFNRFLKRLFDIALSLFGLVLCLPLFIIVILLTKLFSKGPVFFRQKRTGYSQKEFNIIKFRTMKISDDAHTKQATKDDPRRTILGKFLRKTNIDELPQLVNILMGDMSLVGPRPHMLAHTKEFYKKYQKYLIRHWVKPGLTGWAQVNGWRGNSDIGIRTQFDLEYIENWSLFFDMKILFLTVFGKKVKNNAC